MTTTTQKNTCRLCGANRETLQDIFKEPRYFLLDNPPFVQKLRVTNSNWTFAQMMIEYCPDCKEFVAKCPETMRLIAESEVRDD
jgi:hypothetical protein